MGHNQPNKTNGLFNHMASSIKRIRLRYQQSPLGIGLLEMGYVEHDGQEHEKKILY